MSVLTPKVWVYKNLYIGKMGVIEIEMDVWTHTIRNILE